MRKRRHRSGHFYLQKVLIIFKLAQFTGIFLLTCCLLYCVPYVWAKSPLFCCLLQTLSTFLLISTLIRPVVRRQRRTSDVCNFDDYGSKFLSPIRLDGLTVYWNTAATSEIATKLLLDGTSATVCSLLMAIVRESCFEAGMELPATEENMLKQKCGSSVTKKGRWIETIAHSNTY